MTKALTKGEKRRKAREAKKRLTEAALASGLPTLPDVPRRHPSGELRAHKPREEDQHRATLETRCKMAGIEPDAQGLKIASAPHMGTQIGRYMHAQKLHRDEIGKLWGLLVQWDTAECRYRRLVLGMTEVAKCATLVTAPEPFEVTAESTVDLRTEAEKIDAAVRAWMHWQGRIGELQSGQQRAVHQARRDDEGMTPLSLIMAVEGLRKMSK